MEEKICSKCKIVKPITEFHKNSYRKVGYRSDCKDCKKLLSKKYRGEKKDMEQYFEEMVNCPIASVIKGVDRINNHQTMHPVFTAEKQKSYIYETNTYIIPMLKKARHLHVEQESVYENIKFVLKSQMALTTHRLNMVA